MNRIGLVIAGLGVFLIMGAISNWDWMYNSSRTRLLVFFITRTGARIFHIILGIVMIVFGLLIFLDILHVSELAK